MWAKSEQHPLTRKKGHIPMVFISFLLHSILSLEQFLANHQKSILAIAKHGINSINVRVVGKVLWEIKWLAAKYDLVRSGAGSRIPGGVMRPLNPRKESAPSSRMPVNERAQVLLDDAINYLSLPITLRVIRRAHA